MFAFSTGAILLCLATFVIVVAVTDYVSVGSMTGGVLLPFFAALCGQTDPRLLVFYSLIALMIIVSHRSNIYRLLKGTENKTYLFKRRD